MPYDFISDLPDELTQAESQLESLAVAWRERRAELDGRHELSRLHEQLRRRWAIDTGMIEGLYAIDRGTTELLIERGLHEDLMSHGSTDKPAGEILAFLKDQCEVYDWLFDFIKQNRKLSSAYIKEMHALLTRNQLSTDARDQFGSLVSVPLARGEWKQHPNNPRRPDGELHEYCPPEHVAAEIDQLLVWHAKHLTNGVAPEIEAAWLHHRFTQIHPFQDGNGRVARALATLVLIRADRFAFSVSPDEKPNYLDALEAADKGDLEPLIETVVRGQQREFGQALSVAQDLVDEKQIFEAAFAKAAERRGARAASHRDAIDRGDRVVEILEQGLKKRRQEFNDRMQREGLDSDFRAHLFRPPEENRHWYLAQVRTSAQQFDYFADIDSYGDWVRLTITEENGDRATVLVVSVHSLGRTFKGVLSAVAFIEVHGNGESGRERRGPYVATQEPFTFGYLDAEEHLEARFRKWLDDAWLSLLRTWQESM
ncbi:MAG: Fic family protein [Solirubrobacterales bacterium]